MRGKPLQPGGSIEGCIARIEKEARRVIDIDQDGVNPASGQIRIEPLPCRRHRKKVSQHEPAARICHERWSEWQRAALVPIYDRIEHLDDNERLDRLMLQDRMRRVTKAQATHEDTKVDPGKF